MRWCAVVVVVVVVAVVVVVVVKAMWARNTFLKRYTEGD